MPGTKSCCMMYWYSDEVGSVANSNYRVMTATTISVKFHLLRHM